MTHDDALPARLSDDELRAAFDAGRTAADTTGLGLSYTQAMDYLDLAGLRAVARAALAARAPTAPLTFRIDPPLRDGTRVLHWHDGGCRPATTPEIEMWDALAARAEPVRDMVLVPREPDQAWWDAVWKSVYTDGYARGSASVVQVKRLLDVLHAAMIAAAPPALPQDAARADPVAAGAARRWLAVSAGGDTVRLLPVGDGSIGPDVFVRLAECAAPPALPPGAREAMRMAADALGEATTYVESPSWSPSMARECRAALNALRPWLHEGE